MKLALQALALRQHYPGSAIHLSNRGLIWRGELTPSSLAQTYLVEMVADHDGRQPGMFVLAPELQPDGHGRLPHVWNDGALCLSRYGEWHRNSFFIDTVVPWTAEWLFHYEVWLGTGIWTGDDLDATAEKTTPILHPLRQPTDVLRGRRGRPTRRKLDNAGSVNACL